MEPLLCYPRPPVVELTKALNDSGYPWTAIVDNEAATRLEPDGGWTGAIISAVEDPELGIEMCRALRQREQPLSPLLLIVRADRFSDLPTQEDLFDDFVLYPATTEEIDARLTHLLRRSSKTQSKEVVTYGPLALNLETYQAIIDGEPLDLTFMEYELLRFLASHPGKVFTREILLSRVWGYEYYGGARTVDVHVRRLRAKLGAEHAQLIETVRSVGYRFGRSRWKL
jgi:DNA-binding response OmpR family regulator